MFYSLRDDFQAVHFDLEQVLGSALSLGESGSEVVFAVEQAIYVIPVHKSRFNYSITVDFGQSGSG